MEASQSDYSLPDCESAFQLCVLNMHQTVGVQSHAENILRLAYLRTLNIKPGYEKVLLHRQNYSHLLQVGYINDSWVERHYLYN